MKEQNFDITKVIEHSLEEEISKEEGMLLDNWITNDKNLNKWVVDEISLMSPVVKDEDIEHICHSVMNGTQGRKVSLKYFVMTLVAMLTGFGAFLLVHVQKSVPVLPLTVHTTAGEKSRISLPDGSYVILNAESRLSYIYDKKNGIRDVKLNGEAWFDVHTDSGHPFVVDCDNLKVVCKGTEFNITAYNGEEKVSVVLKEGKIKAVSPRQEIEMQPGMMLVYDRTSSKMNTEEVEATDYCNWTKGEIYCNNIELEELLARIARTYDVTFIVKNPELQKEKLYGMILEGDLHHTLDILCQACGAKYITENDKTIKIYKPE